MRRLPVIIVWSFLLMAITTMLLPSCGITGKGRSKISQKEADSIAAEQELQKKSFFEEFGLEDFQPLPSGWNRPTASERRAARDTTFTAPLEVIPVDTAADTKADTLAQAPSGGRPQRPARPEPPRKETDTETEEDETGGEAAGDEQESTGTKKVDYTAEIMRPIHFTDDSTAFYFLGDVVFYHNGAVITCDSAIRFSEKHMEFYKRVVINSGTTFVYGDRVEYNGEVNLARVYSPIVKVVDQDAVLYTYNFSYNTLTERGRYWGGGTVTQGDNRMESVRGYYDTQTREFTGAGDVELINPDYKMVSDSVRYNLDTEIAEFFTPTRIWNAKGEILLSDRGKYKSPSEDYEFTKNSYILTETQEIWADSMEYFSALDNTVMRRDIQIIDEENNAIAFGDYGEYWGEEEYGFLTIEPSLVSFDPDQPDTLYMRSDSMFFYTYPYDRVFEGLANAVPEDRTSQFEELMERPVLLGDDGLPIEPDSEGEQADEPAPEGSVADPADGDQGEIPAEEGTQAEEGPPDEGPNEKEEPSKRQQKRDRRAARKGTVTAEEQQVDTQEESATHLEEELTGERLIDIIESDRFDDQEHGRPEAEDPEKDEAELGQEESAAVYEVYQSPYGELIERLHRLVAADSLQRAMAPEEFWLHVRDEIDSDSMHLDHYAYAVDYALMSGEIDSREIAVPPGDPLSIIGIVMAEAEMIAASTPQLIPTEQTEPSDSVQRVFYGYYNVRIFRDDFQAVCDSIVGFSKDSTLHLHIDPVLWSDQNQVVSDVMILFTKDEQLYKAEFYGSPFMSSEVDSLENQFNQIKGKFMISWFRDNEIYKHDVLGNGQTYYYMEDDKTGEVQGFMVCESADITFYIVERQIEDIIWRWEPDYVIYPIDMIPPDVDQILPGFTWEAARRPRSKEEVHTRFIRPRRREEVSALPLPTFPITEKMDARKEELTRLNMWRDRNDTLAPHALEFIHDMELKYAENPEN